jgi:PIN domain nuclease of toxin-antitoxin system
LRLLLDTHVMLWWREDSGLLSERATKAIAEAEVVLVSAVSAWEVAIKQALGKLKLRASFEEGVAESRFEQLPITFAHADAVAKLPLHRSDPFDRMLAAQALHERLTLVTHDRSLDRYNVPIVWT